MAGLLETIVYKDLEALVAVSSGCSIIDTPVLDGDEGLLALRSLGRGEGQPCGSDG